MLERVRHLGRHVAFPVMGGSLAAAILLVPALGAARAHRWHHSRTLAEPNSNDGSNLLVWDVVVGTVLLPHERAAPAAIGIGDMPAFPAGYLRQLASPFRWRRVKRESLGTARAATALPGSSLTASSAVPRPPTGRPCP